MKMDNSAIADYLNERMRRKQNVDFEMKMRCDETGKKICRITKFPDKI